MHPVHASRTGIDFAESIHLERAEISVSNVLIRAWREISFDYLSWCG